jgi:hypothetical protein
MQMKKEKQLFEYAVLRVVPRVEREEFLNVGVVLFCKQSKFLQAVYTLDKEKLNAFCPSLNLEEIEKYLLAFEMICKGDAGAGPIGKLDPASRFRWLTATRSTVLQCSKVHPGLTCNPDETIARLFRELVL